LSFADAQSFFIVFRKKTTSYPASLKHDVATNKTLVLLDSNWSVRFDSVWGGPTYATQFSTLTDWTLNADEGIKYYSGTAVYSKTFSLPAEVLHQYKNVSLNLGKVNCIAHVFINDKDAGVVWTAPWKINIPSAWLQSTNKLGIEVTNVWANRLIGDEQQPDDMEWLPNAYFYNSGKYLKEFPEWFLENKPRPSKRYWFTTWNYFNKDSPLTPAGLLGPVMIEGED